MAEVFFKSTGSLVTSAGAGAISVVWPNGHNVADVGLMFVECSGADTITTPSGWTLVSGAPLADVASSAGSNIYIFWKRAASGSESSVSITDTGDHKTAVIVLFGGCITSGDPINAISSSIKAAASNNVTCPTVDTTVDGCLVVLFSSIPAFAFTSNFSAFSNGNLTNITEHLDSGSSSGDDGSFVVSSGLKVTAGTVGTSTATLGLSQSLTNVNFTIALTPRPSPSFFAKGGDFQGIGSTTANWPTGHKANDVGLLVIECSGDGATITPSGWNHLPGSPLADVASTAGSLLQVLYKRASSSSEASVTIPDSGDHQIGALHVYRGCKESGNPWNQVSSATKTPASTTATCPTVTTDIDNTLAVLIATIPTAVGVAFGNFTNSNLSSIADRGEVAFTTGNGGNTVVAEGIKETAGSVGTSTTTCTNGTNVTFTIALSPPSPNGEGSGAAADLTLAAAIGAATVSVTAQGSALSLTLVPAAGAVTGAGQPASLSLQASLGAGQGSSSASGMPSALALSPTAGSAFVSGEGSGANPDISLVAASGSAEGFIGGPVFAEGSPTTLTLVAAQGSAGGGATAFGSLAVITLVPALGAVTGAGNPTTISLTAASGDAQASSVSQGAPASLNINPAAGNASATSTGSGVASDVALTPAQGSAYTYELVSLSISVEITTFADAFQLSVGVGISMYETYSLGLQVNFSVTDNRFTLVIPVHISTYESYFLTL